MSSPLIAWLVERKDCVRCGFEGISDSARTAYVEQTLTESKMTGTRRVESEKKSKWGPSFSSTASRTLKSRRVTRDLRILFLLRGLSRQTHPTSQLQFAMASSLRLPAGSFASSARSSSLIAQTFAPASHQYRSFSQASQRWAYKSNNFSAKNITGPSMKARSKEALSGQLPNDLGVLPGTFVRPLWRDLPSVFQSPRDRWQMEWTWLKSTVQNFMRWVTCSISGRVDIHL